jgi:hypothetical protein
MNKVQKRSFHTNVRAINRKCLHTIDILEVIIGSILGKAHANNRTGEVVRICYRQSIRYKEYFSTTCKFSMDPYYINITGFSEGAACFINTIYIKKYCQTGWRVILTIAIELHS